jgi:tripartite motif-containing protein 71
MSHQASTWCTAAAVGLAVVATAAVLAAPAHGDGTGFEVCTVAASCQEGRAGVRGGELSGFALGMATDAAGNVYVADGSNQRIQKYDSFGNWERAWGRDVVAGGGTGFEVCTVAASCKQGVVGGLGGELNNPSGVATDAAGNVYVIDVQNDRIQKFDSSGNFERAWGKDVDSGGGTGFEVCTVAASCKRGAPGGLGGELGFNALDGGLTVDPTGNVYVAQDQRIQKFDSSGNWERAWGKDVVAGGGTGFEVCTVAASCKMGAIGGLGGELAFPSGGATDAAGNVYVADEGNARIQKFDSSGNWERAWGKDVVAGGGTGFEVCTVAASCNQGTQGGLGGELRGAYGLAADPAGNVYVADMNNKRIQAFDSSGNWQRAWGKSVDSGGGAGFEVCTVAASCLEGGTGGLGGEFSQNPYGVAADAAGNVYVSDSSNQRIQKFDSSGNWERAWGRDVVAAAVPTSCTGIPATIVGTDGGDVLRGTRGRDVIAGLGGNDKLSGLAGNDVICGGGGKDILKGGRGNDKLYGGAGKDTLKGGSGKDKLKGGPGKDRQIQ